MASMFSPSFAPEISSYRTSASFVLYLLETYGGQAYLQVHHNLDNFENIYGITIHEMIIRWQDFLDDFVNELRICSQ